MPTAPRLKRIETASQDLGKIEPDRREALLDLAGIGAARQARAIAASFAALEAGCTASDQVRVGKGGNGRLAERPNHAVRVAAARAIWDVLGVAGKRIRTEPSQGPTVTVNLAAFARPGTGHVVEVDVPALAELAQSDPGSDSEGG